MYSMIQHTVTADTLVVHVQHNNPPFASNVTYLYREARSNSTISEQTLRINHITCIIPIIIVGGRRDEYDRVEFI
jgi:hypothetical protein